MKGFIFDKATGRIVQQQTRKIPVIGGNPLPIVIDTSIIEDVRKDSLSIASSDVAFTMETEQNLYIFSIKIKKRMLGLKSWRNNSSTQRKTKEASRI